MHLAPIRRGSRPLDTVQSMQPGAGPSRLPHGHVPSALSARSQRVQAAKRGHPTKPGEPSTAESHASARCATTCSSSLLNTGQSHFSHSLNTRNGVCFGLLSRVASSTSECWVPLHAQTCVHPTSPWAGCMQQSLAHERGFVAMASAAHSTVSLVSPSQL